MLIKNKTNGFTLIELLLYIGLVAIILLAVAALLPAILGSRVKNQVIAEVDQQGAQVVNLIAQTLRNAEGINSPAPGSSASSLSVDVVSASDDPTAFNLSTGVVQIAEGAGSPIALTSSRVTASGLSFQNLSRDGTPGVVRIQFTLTHINPGNRQEFEYSKTFYGSAGLR